MAQSVGADPLRRQIADAVVAEAVALQGVKPVERVMLGKRLLHESRRCLQRVLILATAYHLTGDPMHAERCQQEMLAAARFSDWNPAHFLDVAEMTLALAIGYDWLYDQLDEPARREIREAIVTKGVSLAFDQRHAGWKRLTNNWAQVCHGGLTAGALAVMDHEPELAARTVHNALHNIVPVMNKYAPRGGYPEGPSYWGYGTTFNVILIDELENALGSDFGLSLAPGFEQTGGFPRLATGPSGRYFNYADCDDHREAEPALAWFATRYDRPDWLQGERSRWDQELSNPRSRRGESHRFLPLMLLWLGDVRESTATDLPLQWFSGDDVPVAIHRSSWTDPRATYVGLKGGSPSSSHGHMDSGSFVLESDGVRWAVDLGRESYYSIESRGMNLWSSAQKSDRWKIFRLGSLGHNTLVIDDQLQTAAGKAPIVEFVARETEPYSVVDLTGVYQGQVESARRGVMLLPTGEVLIQDELTGLSPGSRVRWGMVTPGAPSELGRRDTVLERQDRRLAMKLLSPPRAAWSEIDTAAPRHEWDSPNPGTRMIACEAIAPESGAMTIAVVATPGSCREPLAGKLNVKPLAAWRGGD
ncbi:MAG: heparinase II/III family protein [Planctomycetales bacterium]|nr:heparinase II/III family protein [Planctomycetales bacterium]